MTRERFMALHPERQLDTAIRMFVNMKNLGHNPLGGEANDIHVVEYLESYGYKELIHSTDDKFFVMDNGKNTLAISMPKCLINELGYPLAVRIC